MLLVLALLITGLAGASSPAFATRGGATTQVVRTDRGAVGGMVSGDHRVFNGIPYAAPPVGALRWQASRPAAPWRGVRDATATASACAQLPTDGGTQVVGAEDCLYLNVTTPLGRSGQAPHGRPVVVWFHGGAFVFGTGAEFPAGRMASMGDVVVVTVNYRLGVFGFLAHPGLDAPGAASGDYALMDQQAALRWVQRNAAAFGGDPGNVTIAGQSAGAVSVCAHLVSPTARGLFQRAIEQSGACRDPFPTHQSAAQAGVATATAAGCAGTARAAACLRGKSTAELLAQQGPPIGRWVPSLDGNVLTQQPQNAIRTGRWNRVPVLIGGTRDEMNFYAALFYDLSGQPVTTEQYPQLLREVYGTDTDKVLAQYPLAAYRTPTLALFAAQTDCGPSVSWCQNLDTATFYRTQGHVPVYAYEFADPQAPFLYPLPPIPGYGATHASELAYLFDQPTTLTPEQRALGDKMIRYWTRFATTGDPNAHALPAWPKYRTPRDVLVLAPGTGGIRTADAAAEHHYAFWTSLGPAGGRA
ncbi:carboxylesterase family protein [Streptomyces sp. H10-C2]|uniref:carboxylesterase/lipase family protein n=1 Tax=unclassified Streptomyces TaxID=2593676 RepID=UPI0024B9D5FD|nr:MULTISPECIES: carboxylesterase family protein [unclassified Streptomyces]MDJ0346643.1 carboxylesterase family protein [Streptomyces sp. PH10-H1]MDJ0375082.1 carboxylesterase family protein [Streptomyces sp. H10-C2]